MIDENGRERRPRVLLPWAITVAVALFAVGLVASPWFEENVRARLPGALHQPDVGTIASRVDANTSDLAALDTRVTALEARPTGAPSGTTALNDPATMAVPQPSGEGASASLVARVETLERADQRDVTRLDNLSAELASLNVKLNALGNDASESIKAAADSAEKARGVLLVTTARRSAEGGQSLAVLEPALRRYFGTDNAQAVERLLAASQAAPTLDVLRARFRALRPALLDDRPAADEGWWDRFTSGIADIVSVRRATGDADMRRVAAMAARLDRGDVAGALVMLRRLPASAQQAARDWRLDAMAYANVQDALQQLETAVLLSDADLPITAPPPPPPSATPPETTL